MDPQTVIQALGAVLLGMVCYLGKEVRADVKNIRSRLHRVEGAQSILLAVLKTRGLLSGDFEMPENHEREAA